jgi:DNA-directed RNA polymerase specialized sigma24 family protein
MEENLADDRGDTNLNAESLQILQAQNWEEISKRLFLYAIKRAQRYGWIDSDTKLLYGGNFTVDDVVQEVVTKTLSGEWNWIPSDIPLYPWLKYRVNSVMDHWVNSKFRKHEIPFADEDLNKEAGEKSDSIEIEDAEDLYSPEPEVELLNKENTQAASTIVELIFESITGDSELEQLVDYMMQTGEKRPRFIAEGMGTTIDDINNRKKRLYRHLRQQNAQYERQQDGQETPNRD